MGKAAAMTGEDTLETISRRQFFSRRVLGQVWQKTAELFPASVAVEAKPAPEVAGEPLTLSAEPERTVMPEYFSSPLYSYALLSEMPWDMLIDEARHYGISYEGRSKMDVVRELFVGTGGKEEGLR